MCNLTSPYTHTGVGDPRTSQANDPSLTGVELQFDRHEKLCGDGNDAQKQKQHSCK